MHEDYLRQIKDLHEVRKSNQLVCLFVVYCFSLDCSRVLSGE